MRNPGRFAKENGLWVIAYPDFESQELVSGVDVHVVMDDVWRTNGQFYLVEEYRSADDSYTGPAVVTWNGRLIRETPDLAIGTAVMLIHDLPEYKIVPVWEGWRAYMTGGDEFDRIPLRPAGPCVCRVRRWQYATTYNTIDMGLVLLDLAAMPFGPDDVLDDGESLRLLNGLELEADWQSIEKLLGRVPVTVEFWFD